ncbi:copper resistance protein CopC [Streptomyces sp. GESEQ-4]|uniref:copper resistance CopC/CopD family protein n=1 Tax=Streptomyces sp. GESEQ-4 TaxID=2812655 RepID=UPI0027DB802F|nr:copper resistance protein CopC [Streptomyces sp. GESEQ-4]
MAALALLLGTALTLLLAGAGPAAAHAKVRSTDPAAETVLKSAPTQVTMTFTEAMSLAEDSIKVYAPDGSRVDTGTTDHVGSDAATARVALQSGLADGTYTVSWRAVSADSHPIGEAFVFSVGKPSPTKAVDVDAPPGGGLVGTLYSVARYLAYLGYVLAVGVGAFLLVCWPGGASRPRLRRLLQAGWSALLLSGLALLLLRAPYTSGEGLGQAVDLTALRATLDTGPGSALFVRLLLLGGAGLFLAVLAGSAFRPDGDEADGSDTGNRPPPSRSRPGLIGVGALIAVALAGTWAATGHAAAGSQTTLALVADALHLVAVALWLGGLAALVGVLFRTPEGERAPAEAVTRFSRLAFAAVVALVVTGLYQSWRLIGSLDALVSTRFGTLLLLKTAVVVTMLGAAAYSRRWTARLRKPVAERASGRPALAMAASRAVASASAQDAEKGLDPEAGAVAAGAGDGGDTGGPTRRLRRSVAVEAVLALVVLGITTQLTVTTPARTEATSATEAPPTAAVAQPTGVSRTVPFDTGAENGSGKVLITLTPASTGRNDLQAVVFAADNGISSVPELRIAFTHAERGIGPLDAGMKEVGGYWRAGNLQLPAAGKWEMSVTVRISDVDQATVTTTVTVS